MAYLDDNPPVRSQFRDPRRDPVSGVVVLHTAESVMDTVGPDTGAENVAAWIRSRTDPGSYHDLVDADSEVALVRWECEAFHDATGSNPHSLSVSFACSYLDWPKMTAAKRAAFLEHGAAAAARQARWVFDRRGIVVPARKITRAQSDMRVPGFVYHADRDPARRKDPGVTLFPLDEFLARFARLMGYTPPTSGDDDMGAPCAFWRFRGRPEVYCVGADMTTVHHVRESDALEWGQALLRLGGYGAEVIECTASGDDQAWLADILKAAGIPDPRP